MLDQDESLPDDHMAVGKGIAYGVLFGTILWACIIGGFIWWLR